MRLVLALLALLSSFNVLQAEEFMLDEGLRASLNEKEISFSTDSRQSCYSSPINLTYFCIKDNILFTVKGSEISFNNKLDVREVNLQVLDRNASVSQYSFNKLSPEGESMIFRYEMINRRASVEMHFARGTDRILQAVELSSTNPKQIYLNVNKLEQNDYTALLIEILQHLTQ